MKPQSLSAIYPTPLDRTSMTVLSEYANSFEDCQELYEFLLSCRKTVLGQNCCKIVSISLEIPPIDPLAVIDAIAQPDDLHFYLEKPSKQEAIAAIGSTDCLKITDGNRFTQAEKFIQSCLSQTITTGTNNLFFAGVHFFCSFTFNERITNSEFSFPSATIFLPRLQVSRQGHKGTLVYNLKIDRHSHINLLAESVWQEIKRVKSVKDTIFYRYQQESLFQLDINNFNNFKFAVLSSLKLIQQDRLSKIVLAHALDVVSPRAFKLVNSLDNLRQLSPDCYVFSTSNGKGQNFIGASPERLISIQNGEFITDALAGSAARGKTAIEDTEFANRLLSSEKERREHSIVLDFITQRLTRLGLTPKTAAMPKLLKLSNIQHLWTPIQAQVPNGISPLQILAELHPTPAVAGAPRDFACEQIRCYESFDRFLYAAPLGWIDSRGNSEFIVGIRSALIDGDRARLYAGAGIVAGSNPDKELAEIQLKLQSLLKALV